MKTLLLVLAIAVALVPSRAAEKAKATPVPPEYPGQAFINSALKHLTKAQEKISATPKEAIGDLKRAQDSMERASKDKGSFRATAIRVTKQAIRHLEKDDATAAAREVEEAIENTHKAGQQGAR